MTRCLPTWQLALVVGAPALLLISPARADVEDDLGLGAHAAALGGAATAVPVGFASLHHNPAALSPGGDEPGFAELSIGLTYVHPITFVEGLEDAPIDLAVDVSPSAGIVVGSRFDLGRPFGLPGLNAALSLFSPVDEIFFYTVHPDDSVQWLMLTDRVRHFSLHVGLGYQVTPWLSLGASLRVLIDLETFTSGTVTSVTETVDETGETVISAETLLGEDVTVFGRVGPILGALVTPVAGLRFGFTWRGKIFVDDWGWTRASDAPGFGEIGFVHHFSHYFRPHELSLAGSFEPAPELKLAAELTWGLWSDAMTHNQARLGPGRFGDTLTPAAAAEWTVSRGVDLLFGYRFTPSPFDNFGGPTNLLDNDQHVGSAGMAFRIDELTGESLPFTIRWSARLAWLVPREEQKDFRRFESDERLLANPGYPGYRHGGVVPSGQLTVEASW